VTLFLSGVVLALFEPGHPGLQLAERAPWMPSIGASWHLGVDGLSLPFLPATALAALLVLVATGDRATPRPAAFSATVLLLESALLGVYVSQDLLLFFTFWELSLLPVFVLGHLWGAARPRAMARVTAMLLLGGVPLLLAFLVRAGAGAAEAAALGLPGTWSFDLPALAAAPVAREAQLFVFVLLVVGLGVKVPLVPLHAWLPPVLTQGPASLAVLVVGLKIGVYGMLRLIPTLTPGAWQEGGPVLMGLGLAGVLYGALLALQSPDLRRLLAFSAIAHAGAAVVGLGTGSPAGLEGAVVLLTDMALSSVGLMLALSFLQDRLGSTARAALGGVAAAAPRLAGFTAVFAFASLALPGTLGFVGELLVVGAAATDAPWAAVGLVAGGGIGAAALVRALAGALGGPARRPDVAHLSDLQPQETASLGVLAVLVITLGLAPRLLLQATHTGAAVFAGPTAPPPAAIARPRAPSPPAAAPPPLPRRPG
jgi:NADH-quinone oxidoreductase subunit M